MLVDAEDAPRLRQYRWSLCNGYARRADYSTGRRLDVYMHRELLGLPPGRTPEVHHRNENKLDNRRGNLTTKTPTAHRKHHRWRQPRRGYYWHRVARKWCVIVTVDGERRYGGLFAREQDALARVVELRTP